jgi:hypothetical protein
MSRQCCSNINLHVEPLIPLRIGQGVLTEQVECKFLVVDGGKRVLVLCLCQNCLFNQLIQSQNPPSKPSTVNDNLANPSHLTNGFAPLLMHSGPFHLHYGDSGMQHYTAPIVHKLSNDDARRQSLRQRQYTKTCSATSPHRTASLSTAHVLRIF